MLSGKHILLGITGGIAAYKTTFLVRLLQKAGAHVKVILTQSAGTFVSPLTLATLSKNPVCTDFVDQKDGRISWNNHVELALWADLLLIAPATANTLSKMANGTCDNLILATYLSAKCPVYLAPAMDLDMYQHPSTRAALKKLQTFGHTIIPAEAGELASGLHGLGRMAEPENILQLLQQHLAQGLPLTGKKVLITAGPTHETIDPVRFIGNHASGTMGFELAKKAAQLGAKVILITGPTHLSLQHTAITLIRVTSAQDMYQACHTYYQDIDIVIAAAAVADYRPKHPSHKKLKKQASELHLTLEKTPDILRSLGKHKTRQFLVGFALETENELENAKQKLKHKQLDAIILNSLNDKGAGFGTTTNKITFIPAKGNPKPFPLQPKPQVAADIWEEIIPKIHP